MSPISLLVFKSALHSFKISIEDISNEKKTKTAELTGQSFPEKSRNRYEEECAFCEWCELENVKT